LLAAVLQSEDPDQVGRGLEHQLPQLYSHVGATVVVQRAIDDVVFVVLVIMVVVGDVGLVVGAVVGVVVGAVVGVVDGVVEVVVEELELDTLVEVVEVVLGGLELDTLVEVVEVVLEKLELDTLEEVVEDEEVEDGVELDTGGEGLKLWHGWLDSRSVAT
jgi:hypothetical protein